MKLTNNFYLDEFNNRNAPLTKEVTYNIFVLAAQVKVLWDHVNLQIKITSGYRSPEHNAKIGGVKNSQHITGKAADIKVQGMTPKQVYDVIEALIAKGALQEGGLGLYSTWVHYDIREKKARWSK